MPAAPLAVTAPFCGCVETLNVKAAPSGSVPVMVKVAGVSSLVVMVKLFTVGACGAGSLLVGLEEQVQMNKMLKNKMIFLILHQLTKITLECVHKIYYYPTPPCF